MSQKDIMIHLFRAYENASDEAFVSYMGRIQERHEDGKELTVDDLIELANNKFRNMKIQGTWNAPRQD
jgi:hypothetical protein